MSLTPVDNEYKLARLKKACRRGRLDFDEVIQQCRTGECQFFDHPDACAITAISVSGANKFLMVMAIGGTLKGARALLPEIENFARVMGCQSVQGVCRPGVKAPWAENSQGFKPIATVFEKVL